MVLEHIYLYGKHQFTALYNLSDFFKMHINHAWLLKKPELVINLPEEFSRHHNIYFFSVDHFQF